MADNEAKVEDTRAEAEDKPELSEFWLRELTAAGKRDDAWIKRARKVIQRYRDERSSRDNGSDKRANILWSNTEILKAALFQGLGNPDVRRRFPKRGKDEKVTKQAALVMERGVAYSNDTYDCEGQAEACVEDMVLPGRGVSWLVYDAQFETDEETGEDQLKYQSVRDEHVFFEDFRTSSGREEKDIWWKARRHYYSRDELKEYFPEHWKKVPLNAQIAGSDKKSKDSDSDTFRRAACWEIWDRSKKQRIYVAEDYPQVMKKEPDPYRLKDFYPCPPALYGVKTTSDLEPIPEFTLYQDQADELDQLTTRIYNLVDALRRRGVYDASSEGPDNQLSRLALAKDNEFVPYRGFAGLAEKGGLKNVFMTEDLDPAQKAIITATQRFQELVGIIYQVTGISDIMRGDAEKDQTATEASLKANFGSMRLQARQRRVQRFIRDITRLKCELIAEHFSREQLVEMTGIEMPLQAEKQAAMQMLAAMQQQAQLAQQAPPQAPPMGAPPTLGHNGGPPMAGPGGQPTPMMGAAPPPPPPDPEQVAELQRVAKLPTWEEVSAILRSDERRGYKVDVETDQTARIDEEAEKKNRIEFLSTMQTMLEKTLPVAMQLPAMQPLLKESTMFLVKAFKAGRPMEEAFEDAFAQLEKMPPQKQPNPELLKIEAQQKAQGAELQFKAAQAQQDAQLKQQQFNHDRQLKDAELAHQMQIKQFEVQSQVEIENRKMEADQQRQAAELQHKQSMAETEYAMKAREYEQASLIEQAKFQREGQMADRQHEFEREKFGQQSQFEREKFGHQQSMETAEMGAGQRMPVGKAIEQMAAHLSQATQEVMATQQDLKQVVDALEAGQKELVASASRPRSKKIVRDASGRAIGVQDESGNMRQVQRDQSGRAVGLG